MTSRRYASTTAIILSFLQVVFSAPIATTLQVTDPPYIRELPSVEKVMQVMKTADPKETALRQIGAFYQLEEIIKALSGPREFRGLTPDEQRVLGAYQVAEYNVTQAADKSFPAPAGFQVFSDQHPYRFSRWDRRFGVEGIQTLSLFLSPIMKGQFEAIVAGDNARREARRQEYQNPQANANVNSPAPASTRPGSTGAVRKCVESGRSLRVCMSENMTSGFNEMIGINMQNLTGPETPGLRMTGDYASPTGLRLIFLPSKVAVSCHGVGSPDLYTVEVTGTQALVKIQHGPTPLVFSLRADGKLAGSGGPIKTTGKVPSGSHTEQTMGMTTQTTTRERQLSPGEQRNYPDATQNGQIWTVKEDASELVYGATGSRRVTDYVTRTTSCMLGLMTPVGATPLPPDLESPMGILTAIASGAGALMQGKSIEQATKQMLDMDDAPAPGLRMTGNYVGQTGFGITFHPESATLSCGDSAHALRYSIERTANQTFLKVQDKANPLTMQLKSDGSLVGEGTIQVNGRVIVGSTEDPNNPFIYSPKVARCTVGSLTPGNEAAVSTGSPLTSPAPSVSTAPQPVASTTAPGTTQAAPASLAVTSGFLSQPGAANPLAGKTVIVLKDSFAGILARSGWSAPALLSWARVCETNGAECQRGIQEIGPYYVSRAQLDNSGSCNFPNARAGTYYLLLTANYNGTHFVWDVRLDMKPGANSITLDQRNGTPVK